MNPRKMIVTLEHVGLSWWWHQHECKVHCSDGRKVDPWEHAIPNCGQAVEVHETDAGIEAWYFHCSSGQGKRESHRRLLIPRSEYSRVVHTGKEPERPSQDVFDFVKRETGW